MAQHWAENSVDQWAVLREQTLAVCLEQQRADDLAARWVDRTALTTDAYWAERWAKQKAVYWALRWVESWARRWVACLGDLSAAAMELRWVASWVVWRVARWAQS